MDQLEHIISLIALTMGVGWASGINLYATVLMLGTLSNMGHIDLPAELQIVGDPLVLMAAGFMYFVEFFADKVPGVDTGWDSLHTFIRIPAGAALAAGTVGDMAPAVEIAAALVGGTLAAGSHAAKAGGRVLINTSPEPVTNWTASISEDLMVLGGLWAALNHPIWFLAALGIFILLLIWLLPKIWRGIKKVFGFLAGLFSSETKSPQSNQLERQRTKPSAPSGGH